MKGYVLDTSVIIKWFSSAGEPDLASALRLRDAIIAGNCAVALPDLLFPELASALRYNPNFTGDDVKDAVHSVLDMDFAVFPPGASLMDRAVEIAFDSDVTVYDATFLALAEMEGMQFVTADYRFVERLRDKGNVIRLDGLYRRGK